MNYKSHNKIYRIHQKTNIKKWFFIGLGILLLLLLLPWTQNIHTNGYVSGLYQEQRPQSIQSPIPGKIIHWYVKNGDQVKKGDTLLRISEIKEDYMDPLLVQRAEDQINAKDNVRDYYSAKIKTIGGQLDAMNAARELKLNQIRIKLQQLNFKINATNAELQAANNEFRMAEDQYRRQEEMYKQGLVSLTDFQRRNVSYQNALAKKNSIENKLAEAQQEILSLQVEQNATIQDYNEKISKLEGERFQSMGQVAGSDGEIAKLQTQVTNYKVRQGQYYIIATQDGQITQLSKTGIGEIIKEGENIGIIVPKSVKYAVEFYVSPVDLPLLQEGQKIRCTFDGFPAIVFSGWPNSSYGTFPGKIIAVENNISQNGMFKVVVVESGDKKWPPNIKMGAGSKGIILLNDVPIWYEIWRNINGFPPDYYIANKQKDEKNKK